jgi:hypothetical protein
MTICDGYTCLKEQHICPSRVAKDLNSYCAALLFFICLDLKTLLISISKF